MNKVTIQIKEQTYSELLSLTSQGTVYKLAGKNYFRVLKVKKGMHSDHILMIKAIMKKRETIKEGVEVNNYTIYPCPQKDVLALTLRYIDSCDIFSKQVWLLIKRSELISTVFDIIFRGDPLYLYSYQNFFFNKYTSEVVFNPMSTAGLLPILSKKNFTKRQFREVYELLDNSMFDEVRDRWKLLTYKSKLRAIGMFILHLIFKQRISLLEESDTPDEEVSLEQAAILVKEMPIRFRKLLKGKDVLKRIRKAEDEDQVNYEQFLRKVFQGNCQEIQWKQAAQLLFLRYKSQRNENLIDQFTNLAKRHFSMQDQYTKNRLVLLGMAKDQHLCSSFSNLPDPQMKFALINQEIYIRFLLSQLSFNFLSVKDMILSQGHNKKTFSIFFKICSLINLVEKIKQSQLKFQEIEQRFELHVQKNQNVSSFIGSSSPMKQLLVLPQTYELVVQGQGISFFISLFYQSSSRDDKLVQQNQVLSEKLSDILCSQYPQILKKIVENLKTKATRGNNEVKRIDDKMKILDKFLEL